MNVFINPQNDDAADRFVIPKQIHYCWFGRNEKTDLMRKCMASWKKFFPDHQIIEWNEDNFDVNRIAYTREAYEAGKWAFVSDYARLYIVYHYGGIYLDTDVEVIKDFSPLLDQKGYLGFENITNNPNAKTVATGLGFAAKPHDEVISALMEDYHDVHFLRDDGSADTTPCPVRNTRVLIRMGLRPDGSMQQLGDLIIYPFEYFCGKDIANNHKYITENTYSIHHYSGSWQDPPGLLSTLKHLLFIPALQKVIGIKRYDRLKYFIDKHLYNCKR